jgi:CoA:oxalate CoA-transferase
MHKSLDGVRVLDLSRVVSGPFCGAMLADLGAEVIKLEGPGQAIDQSRLADEVTMVKGASTLFISLNRGKKGLTLDLKAVKGKEIFKALVEESDVLIENFRPGVMERLGLSYPTLRQVNPRLIYLSIAGFGEGSPYEEMPAYDTIMQAMSGMMSATGFPDGPPTKVSGYIADYAAGLYGTIAICASLQARSTGGSGQFIEISMLDSIFSLLGIPLYIYLASGQVTERMGNADPSVYPMDLYRAKDGYFALAAYDPNNLQRFCQAIERTDLIPEDHATAFSISQERRNEMKGVIETWASERSVKEILEILRAKGVPAGPLLDIEQISESEHIASRGMLVEVEDPIAGRLRVPACPMKMSETPVEVTASAPQLSEHTALILGEILDLDCDEISQLRSEGVI